jgi:hypothetical protein
MDSAIYKVVSSTLIVIGFFITANDKTATMWFKNVVCLNYGDLYERELSENH